MDAHWVIWSEEHKAWWRPGSRGYTDELRKAGRYTKKEAISIVRHANCDFSRFNEITFALPVDFDELLQLDSAR